MVGLLNRQNLKPRYLQGNRVWLRQTDAQPPPASIGISWKTRFEASSGNATSDSYDVLVGDIIVFPICTNTNFGDNNHTITKSAGTATVGTITQEILRQSGGQSSIQHCRVTGDGTATFTISTSSVRTVCRPVVLTGCHATDWVGAETSEGSSVNNWTTAALTTQAAGSVLVWVDTEWQDLGDMTSSDLLNFNTFNGAGGSMSGGFGHKVSVSASESITANWNAGGTALSDHDMCVVEFLLA